MRNIKHALLACISGAVEHEDAVWVNAVLDEELGLVSCLGEVSNQHTWTDLLRKLVDQGQNHRVVIFTNELVFFDEVAEVQVFGVGSAREV